jgi:Ras GTPase-activating-like protein IQGAP2/3
MLQSHSVESKRFGPTVSLRNDPQLNLTMLTSTVLNVRSIEEQFDIDEFNDLYARTKPTLYIKLSDIFAIHQLISSHTANICLTQDDALRELIRELGSARSNENEMMGVSSSEITLTLNPKLHDLEGS